MMGSGKNIGVGVLGYSDIARRKFIPALAQSTGAVLHAVARSVQATAAATARDLQVKPTSYEELLTDPAIGLVYISLPNHLHETWTLRALQQGKHVICEKPLGLSAASVQLMVACAADQGLLLFENLMYLHHPQHAAVKKIMERGDIGIIKGVRSVFRFPFPAAGNFRLDPARGGGAFHDLAPYAVSTAWYFLRGMCHSFSGFALDRNGLNVGIHGTALTTEGEIFSYSLAFGQSYESSYEIIGEKGKIWVDRAYTTPPHMDNIIHVTSGEKDISLTVPAADHFQLMIADVCTLIRNGAGFDDIHARTLQLAEMAEQMEKGCHHEELRQ